MRALFVYCLLILGTLHAQSCETKRFSLNAYQNHGSSLTLMDLLRDVAQTCDISVVFEDKRSRERLSQSLDMVNIRDYTLPELFTFIFDEHNLFYDYDPSKGVIRVSYYKTVNFNIDYINMQTLSTTSTKSITVGAGSSTGTTGTAGTTGSVGTTGTIGTAGSNTTNGGVGGSNSDSTTVQATSTFTFWDELQSHVQELLKVDEEYSETYNKTIVSRDSAVISVSGTKNQVNAVKRYLDKLESRMHSQVMLEAHLIELTYTDYKTSGVDWSKFSLALSGSYANSLNNTGVVNPVYSFGANLDATGLLNFLNTYGDVEILSNPKVLTLNNQPAVINVGKQLSYLYQNGSIASANTQTAATTTNTLGSVFVGLTLNIVPEVTDDGYIIMRINPVTSELIGEDLISTTTSSSGEAGANRTMPPDTRVKQMTSIVKVKDTQKVLIGGLIEKKTTGDDVKVPLLGDIPYFGRLFHNTTNVVRKSELFILITPTLIKKDLFPSIDDALLKRLN